MAVYPGALPVKETLQIVDNVTEIKAATINAILDELIAIATELGTDVAGAATNLKTRLATLDGLISDIEAEIAGLTAHPFEAIDEFYTDIESPDDETEFDMFVTTIPANTIQNSGEKIKADYFIEAKEDGVYNLYYGIIRVYFAGEKILEQEVSKNAFESEKINIKIIRTGSDSARCSSYSSAQIDYLGGIIIDIPEPVVYTGAIELKVTVQRYDEYSGFCTGKMGEVEWIAVS